MPPELVGAAALLVTVANLVVSYVAARRGTETALRIHLEYLRKDVDQVTRSARAAHRRLDMIQAPAAINQAD